MNNTPPFIPLNIRIVDVSEQKEVNYWSDKLGIKPEVLKGAVRASKSNAVEHIVAYLLSNNKIKRNNLDYGF